MNIKETVRANNYKIKLADVELGEAQIKYNKDVFPLDRENQNILDRFMSKVNDKIRKESKCKCELELLYDSACFIGEGISMRIEADHPNDIRDDDWTWEEVEEILKDDSE